MTISVYDPVEAHDTLDTLNTAQPLLIPEGANGVLVQAFAQNVRFVADGTTTPTATIGFQVKAGDPPQLLPFPPGTQLQFIEEAASATVEFQYVRVFERYWGSG